MAPLELLIRLELLTIMPLDSTDSTNSITPVNSMNPKPLVLC